MVQQIDGPKYNMADIINVSKLEDIPDNWIFFHYCLKHGKEIPEDNFDGRSIRIKSFWSSDSTPSLYFFSKQGEYFFKCFSSGRGGGSVTFVKELENIQEWSEVAEKIKQEYAEFLVSGGKWDVVANPNYTGNSNKIERCEYRKVLWEGKYRKFWTDYNITAETLAIYRVYPINKYTLFYFDKKPQSFLPELAFIYENRDGHPWQIYIPGGDPKYVTINHEYYPGWDQIRCDQPTIAILSGLKDIMAFHELGLKCDAVAGRSESHLIDKDTVNFMKGQYKNVISMCDYDAAGIRIMDLYKKIYGIPKVVLTGERDIAEILKRNNKDFVRLMLATQIDKIINKE